MRGRLAPFTIALIAGFVVVDAASAQTASRVIRLGPVREADRPASTG